MKMTTVLFYTAQFSSGQSHDRFGRRGNMRDNWADILFQSFLQEAIVSSSGMRTIYCHTRSRWQQSCSIQHCVAQMIFTLDQGHIAYHIPCYSSFHFHHPSGRPRSLVARSPVRLLAVREWRWRFPVFPGPAHRHRCSLFICLYYSSVTYITGHLSLSSTVHWSSATVTIIGSHAALWSCSSSESRRTDSKRAWTPGL